MLLPVYPAYGIKFSTSIKESANFMHFEWLNILAVNLDRGLIWLQASFFLVGITCNTMLHRWSLKHQWSFFYISWTLFSVSSWGFWGNWYNKLEATVCNFEVVFCERHQWMVIVWKCRIRVRWAPSPSKSHLEPGKAVNCWGILINVYFNHPACGSFHTIISILVPHIRKLQHFSLIYCFLKK